MYGIKFSNEGGEPRIQYGLHAEHPIATVFGAFHMIAGDLINQRAALQIGTPDEDWDKLTINEDTLFDVAINAYRGSWLLIIKDAYSGSETSTGVDSLVEVFQFIQRWHATAFVPVAA